MAKKFMLICLTLVLLTTILWSSIGIAAKPKPTLTIMYMRHWIPDANDYVEKRVEAWGAANNVNINFEQIAEKDFPFKISIAAQNKTGPDISMFVGTTSMLYKDSLLDVSSITNGLIKKFGPFYPANKAQCYDGKKWIAIPWYSNFPTFMYRIDLLKAAGLKVPETYDELVTVAKALNKPAEGYYGLGMALSRSRDGILFCQSVLWSFGSKMAAADGKTILFNSPETLAGLQYITDLYKVHKVMPEGVTGWDDTSNNKAWMAKQLAMTTNGPSIYFTAKTQDPQLAENTGHATWPKGPAGQAVMMDTYSLGILKYTKEPKLAKALLSYLVQKESLNNYYTAGKGFAAPTLAPFGKLSIFDDPKIRPIIDMLPSGRTTGWPGPVTQAAAEVEAQGVITDMVQRVIVDNLKPQAALDEATKRIKDIYSKYN